MSKCHVSGGGGATCHARWQDHSSDSNRGWGNLNYLSKGSSQSELRFQRRTHSDGGTSRINLRS